MHVHVRARHCTWLGFLTGDCATTKPGILREPLPAFFFTFVCRRCYLFDNGKTATVSFFCSYFSNDTDNLPRCTLFFALNGEFLTFRAREEMLH